MCLLKQENQFTSSMEETHKSVLQLIVFNDIENGLRGREEVTLQLHLTLMLYRKNYQYQYSIALFMSRGRIACNPTEISI